MTINDAIERLRSLGHTLDDGARHVVRASKLRCRQCEDDGTDWCCDLCPLGQTILWALATAATGEPLTAVAQRQTTTAGSARINAALTGG